MRYTPSGVAVSTFNLAVNKSWTNANGERQDKTTWLTISAWRKQAEIVSQYLAKGSKVLVIGEVDEARAYTDKQGETRASLEVTAQVIKFLDSRSEPQAQTQQSRTPQEIEAQSDQDERIPF